MTVFNFRLRTILLTTLLEIGLLGNLLLLTLFLGSERLFQGILRMLKLKLSVVLKSHWIRLLFPELKSCVTSDKMLWLNRLFPKSQFSALLWNLLPKGFLRKLS